MGAPPPALSPAPLTFREPRWLPVRRCMCGLTPNTQNTSVSMKKMHFDRKHEHQPQPSLVHCDSHRQWRAERGLRAPIRLAGRRGTHGQRPARAQHPHPGRTREMLVNCTLIKGAAKELWHSAGRKMVHRGQADRQLVQHGTAASAVYVFDAAAMIFSMFFL